MRLLTLVITVFLLVRPTQAETCLSLPKGWRVAVEVKGGSTIGLLNAIACLWGLEQRKGDDLDDHAVDLLSGPASIGTVTTRATKLARAACIDVRKERGRFVLKRRGKCQSSGTGTDPRPIKVALDARQKVATITTGQVEPRAILEDPKAVSPAGGDRFVVSGKVRDLALSDPMAFLGEGAAFPARGETPGFVIAWLRPGGIFERMGLRAGDVVTSINTLPLASVADAYHAYGALAKADTLVVSVLRNGKRQVLVYDIK